MSSDSSEHVNLDAVVVNAWFMMLLTPCSKEGNPTPRTVGRKKPPPHTRGDAWEQLLQHPLTCPKWNASYRTMNEPNPRPGSTQTGKHFASTAMLLK